jgi:asparagine synthase (glutamine-hydrolysing)
MCGICVVSGPDNPALLNNMGAVLRHRGPDDYGTFIQDSVMMGHRRLSIIDVDGGKQPIFNEEGDKCIICNGEIYNFRNLRNELRQVHKFKTRSDTEVILHLYEEFGTDLLNMLNGMFAFVIFDNGELFAARDRIGIKPLYYGSHDGNMVFASEIKALKHCSDISEFPPGHYYTGRSGFKQYYKLSHGIELTISEDEICKSIREKLYTSVRRRLVSDVPVGVFLSGGIDSSIIAALMNPHVEKLHSFSVGTEGSEDLLAARKVASYLQTRHHEYIYTEKEVLKELDNIIYYLESYDAPLVRSAIPNYFVARLAKGRVKVILTGEGADELFSGYHYLKGFNSNEDLSAELLKITSSLHNINLQRTDRMTMAHSIEARVPFLDHEFVEFALSIPVEMKKADGSRMEKHLLRKSFEEYLPKDIVWRRKLKFSEGSGAEELFSRIAEKQVSDKLLSDFRNNDSHKIRGKDELVFYNLYNKHFSYCKGKIIAGVTEDY